MNKNFFLITFLIIVLDQITKFLLTNVSFGIFNYTTNTGAAFSLFQEYTNFLIIVSILVIVLILYYYKKYPKYWLGLSFVLGGTLGNLIDRIFLGYVTDFISVGSWWPSFNIADSANTVGVMLLLYRLMKDKK